MQEKQNNVRIKELEKRMQELVSSLRENEEQLTTKNKEIKELY